MDKIKLKRTSVEQTGVVIVEDNNGNIKQIPLYSNDPCEEARDVVAHLGVKLKDTYYTSNLMEYKIEDMVEDFTNDNGFLPENFMDEMVIGFPFIFGMNNNYCYCYK